MCDQVKAQEKLDGLIEQILLQCDLDDTCKRGHEEWIFRTMNAFCLAQGDDPK